MNDRALKPGSIWKHFKGRVYRIVGVAKYSEDMEKDFVIYGPVEPSSEYGPDQMAVRPKEMFLEEVARDGKTFWRFEKIKD
jgi:hypothetical protein